jgi:Kef-type K+ transport system membrane component KefB
MFVSLSMGMGFSLPIGAFLAGIGLAQSVYRIQISGKVKPLRDFFIMLFFLDIGIGLSISGVRDYFLIALIFLTYSVIVKPLFFFILFSFNKFKVHPSFQTGIVLSSISEFSLIM